MTGNRISLYNGAKWIPYPSVEFSLALTLTAGKPYDVFCYQNAGVPTLEVLVWTNDTTRATALAYQNGVLVKSGDATRRYLGSLYSSGANTTEDSLAKRYLWNYYHRVSRALTHTPETTDSWTYTIATWRQANANAANQVDFVVGVAEDSCEAVVQGNAATTDATRQTVAVGVGLDSTSVNSAQIIGAHIVANATELQQITGHYRAIPAAGKHFLAWLEISEAVGTTTWFGDEGLTYIQGGLVEDIRAL